MTKRILVTGSSGYIGSHLCKMLQDVRVASPGVNKPAYDVHGLDIKEPQIKMDHFYNVDITKAFAMDGPVFDAVIHLAALINVGESQERPISYYITNLNGTMNVLNKIKTRNFVFASTGTAVQCNSAYAISKRAAEDVVWSYAKLSGANYTTFRFYNVIGSSVVLPGNPDGLMLKLIEAAKTGTFTIHGDCYPTDDGTPLKDYVHVDEICGAILKAIEEPANKTESLGHGVGYTVREMANIFMKTNDVDFDIKIGPPRDGDVGVYVLEDTSKYLPDLFKIEDLLRVKLVNDQVST